MKFEQVPWPIIILSVLSILMGITLLGSAIFGLFTFSIFTILIAVSLGIVSIHLGKSLWNGKKWAYFAIILWGTMGMMASIMHIVLPLISPLFEKAIFENILGAMLEIVIVLYFINNEKIKKHFGFAQYTKVKEIIRRSKDFLAREDSLDSWLVSLVIVFLFIKFIFFPLLSLATGTSLPLVVVESCSMYHETNFDDWWFRNAAWYESKNITKEDFLSYSSTNGLNKGDIILTWGYSDYKKGDIIIFAAPTKYPLIHRIIQENPLSTKGDHNLGQLDVEKNIPKSDVIGKEALRIPALGWLKLIFFEPFKPEGQRGFCQ